MPERTTNPRIRLVLFDLGGTLIEEREYAVWAEAGRRWDLDLDEERLAQSYTEVQVATDAPGRHLTIERFWQRVLEGALDRPVGLPVAEEFCRHLWDHASPPRLFSDVRRCLEKLRRTGRSMGVVSNSRSEPLVREKLTQTGILEFFDLVVSSGSEGVAKPDAEIFRRAVARAGASADETFYIGDLAYTDAKAARAAGLRSVWLNRGGTGFGDDPPEITSLSELPLHLDHLERSAVVK